MTTYQDPRTGTEALVELKNKVQAVWLSWIAYRAGANYYNLHADLPTAIVHGIRAARRWWVWSFFLTVWLFSAAFILMMYSQRANGAILDEETGYKITNNGLIILPIALLALLVTYCRNVDFCLFKRRFVYKVMRPLVRLIDKLPNWLLYLTVPAILCFPVAIIPHHVTEAALEPWQVERAAKVVCEQIQDYRQGHLGEAIEGKIKLDASLADHAGVGDNLTEWYLAHC
jgi:magnesium-transporting ATPase (P-type)